MKRNIGGRSYVRFSSAVLLVGMLFGPVASAQRVDRAAPLVTDLRRVSVEIVNVAFVDEVAGMDGNNMKVTQETRDKFRLAVVTLRITKPPGERLTLAAADLTLHYYHGDNVEAAACEGLSIFSTSLEVDRPVKMPPHRGPGFVKQTTGTASTPASMLYVDAVFGFIEPTISDIWIGVSQPASLASFRSPGWKNGGGR